MKRFITIIAAVLALSSCIQNDLPYPIVELEILDITVEGAIDEPVIDRVNRTVTFNLAESTDIRNVKITDIVYSQDATPSREMVGSFDMRSPQYVTLSLYQHYEWVITASQSIDRRFNVIGQIGQTEYIVKRVKEESGLEDIKVVATGGLGRIIAEETDAIDIYDPNLTLKGIFLIYKKQNRKTGKIS